MTELHTESHALIRRIESIGAPPLCELSVEQARRYNADGIRATSSATVEFKGLRFTAPVSSKLAEHIASKLQVSSSHA